jgi:hypothetical protein
MYSEIQPGQEFPARWLKKKTSIQQIESEVANIGSGVEEKWLAEWANFKVRYQPEMEIWTFEDEAQWDLHLVGYAIVRGDRLVASIGGIRKKPNQVPEPTSGLAPGRGSS